MLHFYQGPKFEYNNDILITYRPIILSSIKPNHKDNLMKKVIKSTDFERQRQEAYCSLT